jgi:hypothetical protein
MFSSANDEVNAGRAVTPTLIYKKFHAKHAVRFGGYGAMACSTRSPLKAFLYIPPYSSFA